MLAAPVIVVVGASASQVVDALDGLALTIVSNPNWQLGLGSSIRCGAEALGPETDVAVVTLCDMPRVYSGLLIELAAAVSSGSPPVAAAGYDCILGPPCAFYRSQFAALRSLSGDTGARAIIQSSPKVAQIEFAAGTLDIDSPEDLARMVEVYE